MPKERPLFRVGRSAQGGTLCGPSPTSSLLAVSQRPSFSLYRRNQRFSELSEVRCFR